MAFDKFRQELFQNASSFVVKCGTSSITDSSGRLVNSVINRLCKQLASLMAEGKSVTLVTSGAIGAGMGELNLTDRPETLPVLQAVAAVGQGQLMRTFHDEMATHGYRTGQILVNRSDFEDRRRYLNIRNTLFTLHERKILPVINENDVVSVDEIRFGDNDIIAAQITNMLSANALILLTVVDGITDGQQVVRTVTDIEHVRQFVRDDTSNLGTGGMESKLAAAEMVTSSGETVVIANIAEADVLKKIVSGEMTGTLFSPSIKRLSGKRRWIAHSAKPSGKITIDHGASNALLHDGRSLLPSGIVAVEGDFSMGEIVAVLDPEGTEIARGLVNYDSLQLRDIMGLQSSEIHATTGGKTYDEAIHRNNMTLL